MNHCLALRTYKSPSHSVRLTPIKDDCFGAYIYSNRDHVFSCIDKGMSRLNCFIYFGIGKDVLTITTNVEFMHDLLAGDKGVGPFLRNPKFRVRPLH